DLVEHGLRVTEPLARAGQARDEVVRLGEVGPVVGDALARVGLPLRGALHRGLHLVVDALAFGLHRLRRTASLGRVVGGVALRRGLGFRGHRYSTRVDRERMSGTPIALARALA